MKMAKKFISVGVILIILIGMLAGCNRDELNYWDQSVRLMYQSLETDTVTTGDMKLALDLGDLAALALEEEESESVKKLMSLVQEGTLKYEIAQSPMNELLSIKAYLRINNVSEYQPVFEMITIKKDNYIKVAPLRAFAQTYLPEEDFTKDLVKYVPSDVVYLKVSEKEMSKYTNNSLSELNALGLGDSEALTKVSTAKQIEITKSFIQLFDEVIRKGYDGYSMDLVKQDANTFKVTIKFKEMGQLVKGLLNYSLDHSDKIQSVFFTALKNVPNTTWAVLAASETFTDSDKNKEIDDMQAKAAELLKNSAELKSELNEQMAGVDQLLSEALGESSFVSELEILDSKHIRQSYKLDINVNHALIGEPIKLGASGQAHVSYDEKLNINVPDGKIMTLEALSALMPKSFTIYPYEMTMDYKKGSQTGFEELNLVTANDVNYLAYDDLKYFTDATTQLDEKNNKIVVNLTKGVVELPVAEDDGIYYFKVSDLKKLGYSVIWNNELQQIEVKETDK